MILKRKNFKISLNFKEKEKKITTYKASPPIRLQAEFSAETFQAQRKCCDIF